MTSSNPKRHFLRGSRDALPFVLVIAPFGLLFGVVATEAGLNVAQVMSFSIFVIAGASQFTAIQLLSENAPTVVVILTALAVNMRMMMYSASLTPHVGSAPIWQRALVAYLMVDQSYTLSHLEFERAPERTVVEKVAYYVGTVAPAAPLWYVTTYVGAVAGAQIPAGFALDFAVPITFLAMIAPALRTLPHVIAATTSVILALALAGLPFGMGLLIAAIAAMIAGAQAEAWLHKRPL